MRLSEWWNQVIYRYPAINLSRKNVVLNAVNKDEHFTFHASCEKTISTWTLYPNGKTDRTYNVPASLDWDRSCEISIWLRDRGKEAAVEAVDSDKSLVRISGKAHQVFWRLVRKDWVKVQVKAWSDDKQHDFQIDAKGWIDRTPEKRCENEERSGLPNAV